MKVLYINHPESDYGGAFLHNGLCQLLGDTNIFDYPIKKSYHGEVHTYSLPDIPNGVTGPLGWMRDTPHANAWDACHLANVGEQTDEMIAAELPHLIQQGFFQLAVVESTRLISMQKYRDFYSLLKDNNIPIVVHQGDDYEQMGDLHGVPPTLILKREFKRDWPDNLQSHGTPVIPFQFSFPDLDTDAYKEVQVARGGHIPLNVVYRPFR